ncbi:glycoside hydrolase family protein [Oscillibacter sp.]|uniref:glycoside hydrolase family protein n=1 Tax=Oscillibacter sp. TaxID=1945593 RepID=UPI0037CA4328
MTVQRPFARPAGYGWDRANCPITTRLTQNQFDALVSFTYNCGGGSARPPAKAARRPGSAEALLLYNKSGG